MAACMMESNKADGGVVADAGAGALTVMETERLVIRMLADADMEALHSFMGKPEVMYAWEHGFSEAEVRQWIDRQKARYRTDGYGYFALMLRDSGTIIGQAGLMKSLIMGKDCVEIGYILDDAHWHKGYATEAARKCMQYAFVDLGLREVYCSIRPANTSSIRVAEAIGMTPCGSHIIIYNGKSMPHLLYKSERK